MVGPWWYWLIALALGLLVLFWPARLAMVFRTEPGFLELELNLQLPGFRGQGRLWWGGDEVTEASVRVRLQVLGVCWQRERPWRPIHQRNLAMAWRLVGEWVRARVHRGQVAAGIGGAEPSAEGLRGGEEIWRPRLKQAMAILRRFAVVENMEIRLAFGLPDASATARLAGWLWHLGAIGAVWLAKTANLQARPVLNVEPCFDRSGFWATCRLRARIPQAFLVLTALPIAGACIRSILRERRAAGGAGAPAASPPG